MVLWSQLHRVHVDLVSPAALIYNLLCSLKPSKSNTHHRQPPAHPLGGAAHFYYYYFCAFSTRFSEARFSMRFAEFWLFYICRRRDGLFVVVLVVTRCCCCGLLLLLLCMLLLLLRCSFIYWSFGLAGSCWWPSACSCSCSWLTGGCGNCLFNYSLTFAHCCCCCCCFSALILFSF